MSQYEHVKHTNADGLKQWMIRTRRN